jgi:hypothetical protein
MKGTLIKKDHRSFVSSHILECLSLEDSLSVFVKWAFKEREERRYPHLVNIGREIVKKCGGNPPLGIENIKGFTFFKIWNLPDTNEILSVLKLSYDQMPSDMKKCFATLCHYFTQGVMHLIVFM